MTDSMTKVAATKTASMQQEEEPLPSSSFYNSMRLKLYTPAEIEHCERSKPGIQAYPTRLKCSLLLSSSTAVVTKYLLTIFWSSSKLETMIHMIS
jgi:hypothetical protein